MFDTVTADGVAVTEEGDIVRGSRRLETVPHSPDPTEHGSQTDTAPRVQQRITRETRLFSITTRQLTTATKRRRSR